MKKIFALILVFFVIGLIIGTVIAKPKIKIPNIKDDISENKKQKMKLKFNADGYKINKCEWINSCLFCNINIGKLKIKDRAITCDFQNDKYLQDSDGNLVEVSLQDLVDFEVIKIVNAHTKDANIQEEITLKNKQKNWRAHSHEI